MASAAADLPGIVDRVIAHEEDRLREDQAERGPNTSGRGIEVTQLTCAETAD